MSASKLCGALGRGLFKPQRLDGIEERSFARGVVTEKDAPLVRLPHVQNPTQRVIRKIDGTFEM